MGQGRSSVHGPRHELDKRFSQRLARERVVHLWRERGLETTAQDPNLNINADGEFGRPHVVMAMGSYEIPKIDVQVVGNYMGASGDTYAPQALVQLPQGRLSVKFAEADGTYRMPRQDILNIRVRQDAVRHQRASRRNRRGVAKRTAEHGQHECDLAELFGTTFGQGNAWVDPRRMVLFLRGYF